MPKLNIGCGSDIKPGWINLDIRQLPGVDLVCDARKLPMDDGSVDEIEAAAVLEHFWWSETEAVLREWARALKPGGFLTVSVPDAAVILAKLSTQPVWVSHMICGEPRDEEGTHRALFTPALLSAYFELVGVEPMEIRRTLNLLILRGRKHG